MKKKISASIVAIVLMLAIFTVTTSAAAAIGTIKKNQEKLLQIKSSNYDIQAYYDLGSTNPFDDARAWARVWVKYNTTNNNVVNLKYTHGSTTYQKTGTGKGTVDVNYYPYGIDYMTGYSKASHNNGENKAELTVTN